MAKVSVIIATRNEEDTIGALVRSLKDQTEPPYEILVIDGNSSDRTRDVAKKAGAKVIPETGAKRSPSNAWNIGVSRAKGDIVLLLGGDFLIEDRGLLKKATKPFAEKRTVGVYTSVRSTTDTFFKRIMAASGKSIQPFFIRRDIYRKLGGYPVLGYGEEMVLTQKLLDHCRDHGTKMPYIQEAYIGGHPVGSLHELFWQAEWYGRTMVPFLSVYKKNFGTRAFSRKAAAMNMRSAYVIAFLSAAVGSTAGLFVFASMFALTVLKNLGKPLRVLKVFTNLVYGFGFLYGLLRYAAGDRRLGRR